MQNDKKYNGGNMEYFDWLEETRATLMRNGLLWVIEGYVRVPIEPHPHAPPALHAAFRKEFSKFNTDCEKALGILLNSYGEAPKARISIVMDQMIGASYRAHARKVMEQMRLAFGQDSHVTKDGLEVQMEKLPVARTPEEAIKVMADLQAINNRLRKVNGAKNDNEMSLKLYRKLDRLKFHHILERFEEGTRVPFMTKCDAVRRSLLRMSDVYDSTPQSTTSTTSTTGMDPFGPSSTNSIMAQSASRYQTGDRPRKAQKLECFNCHGAHYARDCRVSSCRFCEKFFSSPHAHDWHNCMDCPNVQNLLPANHLVSTIKSIVSSHGKMRKKNRIRTGSL